MASNTLHPQSRSPRRLRLALLTPHAPRRPRSGRRLLRRLGGAALPGGRTRGAQRSPARAPRSSTSRSTAAKRSRSWSRSSSCTRCAAASSTSTCSRCSLDEAIQAEVAIELEGVETAPGVKGGGVLEHVTREITVEALPTDIPDNIVARRLRDGDQRHPSALRRHRARRRHLRRRRPRGGHDRHPLAAARRRSRSPRSRRRPSWSARARAPRATRPPRAATPARARASSSCRCSAAADRKGGEEGDRILIVGLGNPGPEYDAHPPQRRLRRSRASWRGAGTCRSRSRSSTG